METLMKILVRTFFLFAGDRLKGDRTALVAILGGILAVWQMVTNEGLFGALCGIAEQFAWFDRFCNIEQSIFYSIMVAIMVAVTTALKYLDTNEMGLQMMKTNGYTESNFARLNFYALAALLIGVGAIVVGLWHMGVSGLLLALLPIWLLFGLLAGLKLAVK